MNQMKEFKKLAVSIFKDPLEIYGFKKISSKSEEYFCEIIFSNNDRYIKVNANIHPRDYPPYFNVVLGEGGLDFFESDWNSVALWRLINFTQKTTNGTEYSLKDFSILSELLEHAQTELMKFGAEFLNGNLEMYRQARSDQNKDRPPYKIYSPDKNGKYTVCDEPKSVKMKKKFS